MAVPGIEATLGVPAGLFALSQVPVLARGWRTHRYECLDGGLVTTVGHLPWDFFEAFALTDGTLVLYGSNFPLRAVEFDRASVSDLDAVVAFLDEQLSQTDPAERNASGIGGVDALFDLS